MATNARRRQIGALGTAARVVLGLVLLVSGVLGGHISVIHGQVGSGFEPLSVAVGVIGFPAVLLAWQWLRARIAPTRLQATGPVSTALNMLVLVALVLTPWYARPLSFTSDAALVFYGASMLLAALRGYNGCEVLAISNWILGRDDQVGCLVLGPVDDLERRFRISRLWERTLRCRTSLPIAAAGETSRGHLLGAIAQRIRSIYVKSLRSQAQPMSPRSAAWIGLFSAIERL